jgi:hypothetical protein
LVIYIKKYYGSFVINPENHIYKKRKLDEMSLQSLRFSKAEKYESLMMSRRETDRKRDATDKRKEEKKAAAKKEVETDKGKEEKRVADRKRDAVDKRKEEMKAATRKRIETDKGKEEKRVADRKRYATDKRKEANKAAARKKVDTEKGKEEKRVADRKRDENDKRKEEKAEANRRRDRTQKRIDYFKKYENIRSKSEKRRIYLRNHYTNRYLASVYADTGFNVICTCCIEFKSCYTCTGVQVLTKELQKKFLSFDTKYVSKDGKRYICKSCRSQIKDDKEPTKSEKEALDLSNFPLFLKRRLMKVTNYLSALTQYDLVMDDERNIDKALQLNKLESHLLKLVIPFIRIGHCPRGRYFKVRGNLILISADVKHSMSRILPKTQKLLPVSFKRKLCYTGSFIEEIIDRNKIQKYFNFFKMYKPLFKNIEFNQDLVNEFESECAKDAEKFENVLDDVNEDNENCSYNTEESGTESGESDLEEDPNKNPIEDDSANEKMFFRDQTTIFCNKYETDVNASTVASKLANLIVNIETSKNIDLNICSEDLDVNDEINLEEIDFFIDEVETEDIKGNAEYELKDEFVKDNEISVHFTRQNEEETKELTNQSKKRIRETLNNIEKISVAPGESGVFQNWGKDAFLEEKCFPDLFPYGVGGYISSTIGKEENKGMGFAMYVKHRILSADPKYRNNNSYLFFLLLVKELIQLNRCKQTYLRQATKTPNLTKETVMSSHNHDLSRYNRSYEVFKTLRGTSMYFEESKKNVMALLRQNGSPSLFLTLSCAEYSWETLLKEIVEHVEGKEVSMDYIKEMAHQKKNKLISENVVLSTLHFQKRIEKELKLMNFPKFLDDNCPFSLKSYYYRVEFQQRGAPHIHCLLWLQDY